MAHNTLKFILNYFIDIDYQYINQMQTTKLHIIVYTIRGANFYLIVH